jgi:hypothetical protein
MRSFKISQEVLETAAQMYFNDEDWKKYLEEVKKVECKDGVCEIPFAEIIEKDLCKDCCKECNLEECPLREMD